MSDRIHRSRFSRPRRRLARVRGPGLLLAVFLLTACGGEWEGIPEDERQTSTAAPQDGVLYFHGMPEVAPPATQIKGPQTYSNDQKLDLLAPEMATWSAVYRYVTDHDAELRAFLDAHEAITLSGFSLGRLPFFQVMKNKIDAPIKRAVLFDPAYITSSSGSTAVAWLERDPERRLLLVYGPSTRTKDIDAFRAWFKGKAVASQLYRCSKGSWDHLGYPSTYRQALQPGWELASTLQQESSYRTGSLTANCIQEVAKTTTSPPQEQ